MEFQSFERQFENLSKKYRGLRKEDLEHMNPSYSCVICKKFKECGKIGYACEYHEIMTEEEFANIYDFKGE